MFRYVRLLLVCTLCFCALVSYGQGPTTYSKEWKTIKLKGLNLMRLEVPGGWLVREGYGKMGVVAQSTRMMIFVPDPQHEWVIEGKPKWEYLKLKGLNLYRLAVPTGWLVREGWGKFGSEHDINMICFIEDPTHSWVFK